tara:strand:- start:10747 stop:10977 length:231 start_codon:yes stop_codon:yes gene_type:complete
VTCRLFRLWVAIVIWSPRKPQMEPGEPSSKSEEPDDTEAIIQFLNHEMDPAVDLGFCNPGTGGHVVVWIEPAAVGE